MDGLDTEASFMDELLDFSSDIGEQEDDDDKMMNTNKRPRKALSPLNHNATTTTTTFDVFDPLQPSPSPFPEFVEEDLEWLSNKDAFPTVETLGDILSNPISNAKLQSPVSVLENSSSSHSTTTSTSTNESTVTNNNNGSIIMNSCGSFRVPVRSRSKRRRTRRQSQESWWAVQENVESVKPVAVFSKVSIGRKCQHCGAEKTPQWRAGPMGPKTLCNACGVRYKSGRLVPEYRPANSPTFSSELHSNSHRKVMEMRRQKMMPMESGIVGMGIVKPVDRG